MPQLTRLQIGFLAANAVLGLVVGLLHARVPAMQVTAVPLLAWLVAGLLVLDLGFGRLADAHPTQAVSMPVRLAALVLSYIAAATVPTLLAG
jgi:hypothetical protein